MGNSQRKKGHEANPAPEKVQNLNGHAVDISSNDLSDTVVCEAPVKQNCEPPSPPLTEETGPTPEAEEVDGNHGSGLAPADPSPEPIAEVPAEQANQDADAAAKGEEPKSTGREAVSFFDKLFKNKKSDSPPKEVEEEKGAPEEEIAPVVLTNDLHSEPVDIKRSTEPEKEPESESLDLTPAEVADESTHPEESHTEENPVMNFFKTLVTPTKTPKEATATSDVSKDQSQKETQPAPTPNVQEVDASKVKIPPPPPPEPPKMESKAELAVKKEEAPEASKTPDTPTKQKAKDSAFSKLFRPKVLLGKVVSKVQAAAASTSGASAPVKPAAAPVEEPPKPVEVQVDASKAATLEASAKPEPPPAPAPEEKKPEKKPSSFASFFKPKVLLGQLAAKIQAATSGASTSASPAGAATEPKKDAPAAPAVAEAAQIVKAKEEPKPAAVTATADNKSVDSADASPSMPRKLEKRNSIHLFFKNLGQKRHSDAGVQTEPVPASSTPEKAK